MLDNILLALHSLRSNRMRALLTMLGIIIGIGAVIAIKTVGNSLTGSITDSMSGYGISNISVSMTQKSDEDTVSSDRPLRMFMDSTPDNQDLITDDMIAQYRTAFPDQVAAIELTVSAGTGTVTGADGDAVSATVSGINDEYTEAESLQMLYGRAIDNEKDGKRKVCVVADQFVTDVLGILPINAVGKSVTITVSGTPVLLYIEGVYKYEEDDSLTMSSSSDDIVTALYLPLETAREITGGGAGWQSFTVVASSGTDTTAFLTTTENYFASFYTMNDTWTVETSSMESLVSSITEILDTVSLAISAIAAISLLVGGIGVMNIMLVSITERTREIGTRKALGAPRSSIRLQFIVEAVVICLIGGLIGIGVGTGLGAIACKILGYTAKADTLTIMLAVGFSMVIGVFFGYYPANKAAKLDPIEALRYE